MPPSALSSFCHCSYVRRLTSVGALLGHRLLDSSEGPGAYAASVKELSGLTGLLSPLDMQAPILLYLIG